MRSLVWAGAPDFDFAAANLADAGLEQDEADFCFVVFAPFFCAARRFFSASDAQPVRAFRISAFPRFGLPGMILAISRRALTSVSESTSGSVAARSFRSMASSTSPSEKR